MDHSEVKYLPKVDHTPADLDAESRILLAAADRIETHGWCQGSWYAENGSTCLRGAIYKVGYAMYGDHNLHESVRSALRRIDGALSGRSMGWNDTEGRSKDQVVAKLRAVALGG